MQRPQSVLHKVSLSLQALSLLCLSGCATPIGNCKLLPLKEYDDAFKAALAVELSVVPAESATFEFIVDAIRLRDATRACQGEEGR